MTLSDVLSGISALGALLAGVAAILGLINRRHIQRLRTEVNGQSHALVEVSHALGVSEGHAIAQSEAFDRGDTKGTP